MADYGSASQESRWYRSVSGRYYYFGYVDGQYSAIFHDGEVVPVGDPSAAQSSNIETSSASHSVGALSNDPRYAPQYLQGPDQLAGYSQPADTTHFAASYDTNHGQQSDSSRAVTGSSAMSVDVTDELDPSFRRRSKPRDFFRVGKVFQTPWTEPVGRSTESNATDITRVRYGEVHTKLRRFVVIQEGDHHCIAVPITTYGSRGISKPDVRGSDHAIIHTGRHPPDPLPSEYTAQGHTGMPSVSIRVDASHDGERLHPTSRINYGKIYTIEHYLKVRAFGVVLNKGDLLDQFRQVFNTR